MKNFDRKIEQMMNESEVAPPFGMWNRIAAELETEATVAPVSVNSPIPQRSMFGFIAGALLISASLLSAYLVNEYAKEESTVSLSSAVATKPINVTTTTEIPTLIFREEAKHVTRIAKSKSVVQPVSEKLTAHKEIATALVEKTPPLLTEVSVPNQPIAQNSAVTEQYYFPAIDINTRNNKVEEKATASIAKAAKSDAKVKDDDDQEVSSYEPPRIKFRPRKHRSFSYGKIIRSGKR